jgi:hypothetical protein
MDTTLERNKLHQYIDKLDSNQLELLLAFIVELFDLDD